MKINAMHNNYSVDYLAWRGLARALSGVRGAEKNVFERLGVDRSNVEAEGVRSPLRLYVRFFDEAASVLQDPAFGFKLGYTTRPRSAGIPGYLVLSAPDLQTGLAEFCQHFSLLVEGVSLGFIRTPQTCALTWEMIDPQLKRHARFADHVTVFFTNMVRGVMGRSWRPSRVDLSHVTGAPHSVVSRVLCRNVRFGQSENFIHIPPEALQRHSYKRDLALFELMRTMAKERQAQRQEKPDLEEQIRTILKLAPMEHYKNPALISDSLGLTPSALQRLLRGMGSTMRSITDDVRFEKAQNLLRATDQSVADIAERLGYSEPAAFIRAFKKRFDSTPRLYRQLARQSGS
ncbi:MAG: AraC family transcriptional regulator ligand-binding domain-containing protein [Stappiaceae bacterium]